MPQESLRLDEILGREIAINWHEGVAVIQAVCRSLPHLDAYGAHFPRSSQISIAATGVVEVLGEPSGSPGVLIAGQLLGDMLQSDVPGTLRLIHSESVATTPAFQSLGELAKELAYFERPDGQLAIQELYARAAAATSEPLEGSGEPLEGSGEPLEGLGDLDDFLSESAEAPSIATPHPIRQPGSQDANPRYALAAALVVVLCAVASGAILSLCRQKTRRNRACRDVRSGDLRSENCCKWPQSGWTAADGRRSHPGPRGSHLRGREP